MLQIPQKPAFLALPAGQQMMFVISEDSGIMQNEQLVKVNALVGVYTHNNFTGAIHVSSYASTPNDKGVAMFDFGPVVENYVRPQRNGVISQSPLVTSQMNGINYDEGVGYHSIHNIDKYCYAPEVCNYLGIVFTIEYMGGGVIQGMSPNEVGENLMVVGGQGPYFMYNGVIYKNDILSYKDASPDFGYNLAVNNYILNSSSSKFLTDMPTTVDARPEDYGTVAFFNAFSDSEFSFDTTGSPDYGLDKMEIKMYDIDGGQIGSALYSSNRETNGGWSGIAPDSLQGTLESRSAQIRYLFWGFYPANIRATKAAFDTELTNGNMAYYTVQAVSQPTTYMSRLYRINILRNCLYEPLRLAWLNKHGAWDYYTFMKKNVTTLESKRTHFEKLDGSWNESSFNLNTQTGGKTTFKTNTTEKIELNTDFITEEEAVWLEQLMTSNELLIIEPYYSTAGGFDIIHRFTKPCTLKTGSFIKKTRVNDKLIQYKFEIEKSHPIKSQGA